MFIDFVNRNQDQSLDENGDLFEPVYRCFVKAVPKFEVFYASLRETKEALRDLQEIKKFFEFVDNNKKSIIPFEYFKEYGYRIKEKFYPRVDYLEIIDKLEV